MSNGWWYYTPLWGLYPKIFRILFRMMPDMPMFSLAEQALQPGKGWAANPGPRAQWVEPRPPPMPNMPRSFPHSHLSVSQMRPGSKQISPVAFDVEQAPKQPVNLNLDCRSKERIQQLHVPPQHINKSTSCTPLHDLIVRPELNI